MSDYMEAVHSVPCVICLKRLGRKVYGVHAHHAGEGSDRDDHLLVALCPEHHQGATGIHGMHRRGFHRFWKTTDMQLIAWTNELLWKQR
jgi:hypothetical protein